jgi:hypothetical protein
MKGQGNILAIERKNADTQIFIAQLLRGRTNPETIYN